jgi:hypothetical protein
MTSFTTKVHLGNVPLIGGRISAGAKVGLKAAGLYVKGAASTYPPVRRRKVDTKLWTIKQRRYFFAALRKGEIVVPYTRGTAPKSERAGARWAVDERRIDAGRVTVGNNASYAPRLYDRKAQSWYHKGNWPTTTQIAKKTGPEARRIVRAAVAGKLQGK